MISFITNKNTIVTLIMTFVFSLSYYHYYYYYGTEHSIPVSAMVVTICLLFLLFHLLHLLYCQSL